MAFLTSLWNGLKSLAGLVLPVLGKARAFRGWSRWLFWVVHLLLVGAILVGLYFLGGRLQLWRDLPYHPVIKHGWLPILFLLIYVLAWLGWWFWKLLAAEEEGSDFPDIDAAWEEAKYALDQMGIGLADAPLFLILGRPAGSEEALFQAAQLQLNVKQAPQRPNAPLHVYANRDGIYVTCVGASLLGQQAAILGGDGDVAPVAAGVGVIAAGGTAEDEMFKTLPPRGRLRDVTAILDRAREQGRSPGELTDEERQEIRRLIGEDEVEHAQQVRKSRPSLLKDTAKAEYLTARLQHLCRLLVRDRRPYCPINGILLLVPFAGTDSEEDANQTSEICRRDLVTARGVLKVHCPLIALECDLEATPGFRDFIDRFPQKERQRRVGQRFPLAPDVNGEALSAMIDGGVQ